MAKNADSYDLHWARTHVGRSQQEVADLLDTSRETISRWETGKRPIPKRKLARALELLEVSREEIPPQPATPHPPTPVLLDADLPLFGVEPDTGDEEADQWLREQNVWLEKIQKLLPSLSKKTREAFDLDDVLQKIESDFLSRPLTRCRTLEAAYWHAQHIHALAQVQEAGLWKVYYAAKPPGSVYGSNAGESRLKYEAVRDWLDAQRPSLI